MKNLKLALSKDISIEKSQSSSVSNSFRSKKSNASSSVWSIVAQLEEEQTYGPINNPQFTADLLDTLSSYNKMGKAVQEDTLSELIASQQHNFSTALEEKDSLDFLQKKMIQLLEKPPIELENYIRRFVELIRKQKRNLKSKDVTTRKKVKEFDQIADKVFKKTAETKKQQKRRYLEINLDKGEKQAKSRKKSKRKVDKNSNGTKNSGDSQDSAEGRLGKLLQAQRYEKKEKVEDTQQTEESYTFSSMISASVTVKQRSRNSKADKKDMTNVVQSHKAKDSKPTDEAFIFYRPKKRK